MNPKTMKSMMVALMPAMLLAPAVLGAQAAGAARAQTQARTPQARIDAALGAAARADVPVELVRSKVAEGEAKRVPQERIAAAVEARVTSLVRASEAMKRGGVKLQSAGELAVAADALDAGVEASSVIRVAREAPEARRTVAIAVLSDLVRLGATSDRALARVSAAVSSSAVLANLQAEAASQLSLRGLTSTLDAVGTIRLP
ncbi:MAG: hypothetical protein ACYC2G_02060 [Gemmatimonadaceae bacterium]